MRIVQFQDSGGERRVGLVGDDGHTLHPLKGTARVYDLALHVAGRSSRTGAL